MRCSVATLLLLAACGTPTDSSHVGDAANGQKLFIGEIPIADGSGPACNMCHAVQPDQPTTIGPNLSNVGNRAATTIEGMSAEEYLRTSVIDPDAYLAGGFQEGIHWRGYKQALTPQQVNDLIAYMLTLTSGQDN